MSKIALNLENVDFKTRKLVTVEMDTPDRLVEITCILFLSYDSVYHHSANLMDRARINNWDVTLRGRKMHCTSVDVTDAGRLYTWDWVENNLTIEKP